MREVMRFSSGPYAVETSLGEPLFASLAEGGLREDFGLYDHGTTLVVAAGPADRLERTLIVSQQFDPGPDAGFHPGILVVPETHLLFIGAGTRLLAYDLSGPRRLWHDEADTGFWFWQRHDQVIVMSAELELAAWDIRGRKIWTTFVEPPWSYEMRGSDVVLDVMGRISTFPIGTGPRR